MPDNKATVQDIINAIADNTNEDDEACAKVLLTYYDYGDAPDSLDSGAAESHYLTLAGNDGARHALGSDVYLGQCVDSDVGDTAQGANSDDNQPGSPVWGSCGENGDEDGVVFTPLQVGKSSELTITANKACQLNAWVDWDGNGSWEGGGEHVFVDEQLLSGSNTLSMVVPARAKTGDTYARFRCSSEGGDEVSGTATDGEVEDYRLSITSQVSLSLGDYIWLDGNKDGLQTSGEIGLAGAEVALLSADGTPARDLAGALVPQQTITTTGKYQFNHLPEGEYIVRVTPPSGYIPTADGGDVDENDSNADSNCQLTNEGNIQTLPVTLTLGGEPDSGIDGDDSNSNLTVDCGFYKPEKSLALGNYVWVDADVDGFQDNDESGLAGVTVNLTDADGNTVNDIYGNPVTSVTTDVDGLYRFDDLANGDYIVTMTPPSGYYLTTGGLDVDDEESNQDSNCIIDQNGLVQTHPLTLSEGGEPIESIDGDGVNGNLSADCGFYRPVSVGDYIWEDANADGVQDADESGLPGMTVSLTDNDGISPVYDVNGELVEPVVTDSSGHYEFDNLTPGEYSIIVRPPEEGYKLSPGGDDPDENDSGTDSNCRAVDSVNQTPVFKLLALDGQRHNATVDCGFYRSVGVGSRIWIDLDADGRQDASEPGVPGATITLLNPDGSSVTDLTGNVVRSQLSGANGEYFFGNLREGDYVIKVTPPDGYLPTIDNGDPDNDDGSDSNGTQFSSGSVLSTPITLVWGEEPDNDGDGDRSTNLTVGFGFVPKTAGVQIPTASSWTLGLLSLLLSAATFWRRHRDS